MRMFLIVSMILGISAAAPAMSAEEIAEQPIVEEEIIIQGRRNLSRHLKNGFAAFREGNFKKAESYFYRSRVGNAAFASDPDGMLRNLSYATIYGPDRLFSSTQHHEFRRANSIIYYMEGMSQLAQGRHMSARRSFMNALGTNPKHFDARADLALIEIKRGKFEVSATHIKRLAKDFSKCDAERYAEICPAIGERLLEVEQAYGLAVSG